MFNHFQYICVFHSSLRDLFYFEGVYGGDTGSFLSLNFATFFFTNLSHFHLFLSFCNIQPKRPFRCSMCLCVCHIHNCLVKYIVFYAICVCKLMSKAIERLPFIKLHSNQIQIFLFCFLFNLIFQLFLSLSFLSIYWFAVALELL